MTSLAREPGSLRLAILASGRGSNLEAILAAIDRGDLRAEVALVFSDQAGAAALDKARDRGIMAVHLDPKSLSSSKEYHLRLVEILRQHRVDLIVLAGYMRIVGRMVLEAFHNRILNIHPSLLPSFPGLEAQKQAIEHGVKVSGCTVHFVDAGMDTGPIIAQRAVPVEDGDTPTTLAARILVQEHDLYWRVIKLFGEGRLAVEGRRVMVTG